MSTLQVFHRYFEWWKDCYNCSVDQYCFKTQYIVHGGFFYNPWSFFVFSLKKVICYATDYSVMVMYDFAATVIPLMPDGNKKASCRFV